VTKRILFKTPILWWSLVLVVGLSAGVWGWYRFGPSDPSAYQYTATEVPLATTQLVSTAVCDLEVRHYRQIGRELQLELYASKGGLAPFTVEITQRGKTQRYPSLPNRRGVWLTVPQVQLESGAATVTVRSEGKAGCITTAGITYRAELANSILPPSRWIRHGSRDTWLDVRPELRGNKIFLKDFANYQDGRTRVYLIDNVVVTDLEKGVEVKPGYLYSVIACWIDAPYGEWWNKLRHRTIRQQNIWIDEKAAPPAAPVVSALQKVEIPGWFSPSRTFNVQFDTSFPEFEPIPGKLVMQYRMNADVPAANYLKRGITHLPRWEEKNIPFDKQHWTEGANFFQDKNQDWFGSLTKQQVEEYADRITPLGVYAFDFEYWHNDYTPAVRQRLIWFAKRLRERHPSRYLFDFWGGPAYRTKHFYSGHKIDPDAFLKDYQAPAPNHTNFTKTPDGDFLGNYFNINMAEVYPRSFFSNDKNTHNNYLILSAVHTTRINKLIPFQKNNKNIWFGWNRYQPQYDDPINPWHIQTSSPDGEIVLNQLVTMPASQALGISLFSLVTADGYYLWHDDAPKGRGNSNYTLGKDVIWGWEWYPADNRSGIEALRKRLGTPDSPPYWDYPTEYYALGNWMAKQVEDILVGGTQQDLPYKLTGTWTQPRREQAVLSAVRKEPFVTSVVNGKKIAVLAIDSFQDPAQSRQLTIRLPNGKETTIELYGNWPSLYRGEL
jgi:hypothetical protein